MDFIITIGRETGSMGRTIGRLVSEKLNVSYYDKENYINREVANRCELSESSVREESEKKTSSFLYSIYALSNSKPVEEKVYIAQKEIINELADKGSCVIVGNCADYFLNNRDNVLKVFIHAPIEKRLEMLKDEYEDANNMTMSDIKKADKRRASYYEYYTFQKWGDKNNYDITLNSAIGIESSVNLICAIINTKFGG